ncbi:MAG: hypothetical protein QM780_01465 [Hyphomicrobium sp.]|uniref:hypothetical protein n=1 Tax=Hyphomicrobium sp. TaxID=82 RepID=UPI0039E5DD14
MLVRRLSSMLPALVAAVAVSACAGNGPQLPSPSMQATSGTLTPETVASAEPTPPPQGMPGNAEEPPGVPILGAVGSATDIYSHIARGAMACWFAVNGPLKKDYIFHAAADAPSRGGKATVTIHQRDPTQPNPRGAKAYIVDIQPTGESSASVRAENRKMSEAYATAMTDDISRWSKGEEGCTGPKTAAGWAPAPVTATAAASKPTKKAKAKPNAAKAKSASSQPAAQP